MNHYFRMMQFADSAFPLGGFAFSNGLEWLVKQRWIQDTEGFYDYLLQIVQQAQCFDIPFLLAMTGSESEVRAASIRFNLMLQVPGLRKASLAQGRALLRLLPTLQGTGASTLVQGEAGKEEAHLVLVLGKTLAAMDWSETMKAELWTYLLVRDQTSAAIRLGILGPGAAVHIQGQVYDAAAWTPSRSPPWPEAYRMTALNDMAVASHGQLYSKLFQN